MDALIALLVIFSVFSGLLALLGWLGERKHKPLAKYNSRWPKTRGFER